MLEGTTFFIPKTEDVYDWNGNQLTPEIRECVNVGNIIRIQVCHPSVDEAIYIEIIESNLEMLKGIVLDTYRTDIGPKAVEDGELIEFPRVCIIEVPFGWDENSNLIDKAVYTNKNKGITGIINEIK